MDLKSKLRRLYSTNLRNGQLEYVPGLCGDFFMFDVLYDYLELQSFKIAVEVLDGTEDEWKKDLWKHCKIDAEIRNLHELLNGRQPCKIQETKDYAIRLYKSELVCQCLIRHFNRGKIGEISADEPIHTFWDKEWEDKIQQYLIAKTIKLIV